MDGGAAELSATVIDVESNVTLLSFHGDVHRSTASIGKLLLLIEFAERLNIDPDAGSVSLSMSSVGPVADSGLWQHLRVDELPAADIAVLIGALSDNVATNVLVRHVGLEAVTARAEALGLSVTRLHDVVRDHREPNHPQHLSTGTTDELAHLMAMLYRGSLGSAAQVLEWISHSADVSMVAHAFGLDPLARSAVADRGFRVWSKTGCDAGVRADVGLASREGRTLAFAAAANWQPSDDEDAEGGVRDEVLSWMRQLGADLRSELLSDQRDGLLRNGLRG
jgi:beta-lactamase class A